MTKYNDLLKAIKKYDTIVVLRHIAPDFDACGSQLGLAEWLKYNFKEKEIIVCGEDHKVFSPSLYPPTDKNVVLNKEYLCIVVDVANVDRIDGKEYYQKATATVKIDHHPDVEKYGDIQIVDDQASAACEIIADILFGYKKYTMPQIAAYYLYSGLVGDNGRFQYSSTNPTSFEVAGKLVATGINFQEIYDKMYLKSVEDIKVVKFLYNSFKVTDKGVGYYHVYDKDLKELGILKEQVKAYVNLLSGYNEIRIWVQFTEDVEATDEFKFKVSIRSRGIKINDVASKYNGGGHDNASGAKARSVEETMALIEDLNNLL